MKKLIFIFSFSFLVSSSVAQNYEWRPIIPGINCDDSAYLSCRIRNFTVDTFQNILWVTGIFDGAGGIQSSNCVGFDGTNWVPFPGVMDSMRAVSINDAILYNGDLIICRSTIVEIFSFTSHQWNTIGTADGGVLCLGVYNGDLIAGGRFNLIDGNLAPLIARWNGTQWFSLNDGLAGSTHSVNDVEVYNGKLYAGGAFDYADSVEAWNIAVWDGNAWNGLCSSGGSYGTDRLDGNHSGAEILDMEVFNNKLYITGQFELVCGSNCYLAYWDDTTWHGTSYAFGDGKRLVACNGLLYIMHLGGPWINSFDGTNTITPVDSTFDSGLNDIECFQNTVYLSGAFDNSANTPTFRLSRLVDAGNGINEVGNESGVKIYPNPASETVTVMLRQAQHDIQEIVISNLLGEVVQSLKYKVQRPSVTINISKLPRGIYLLRVQTNDGWQVGKVVKE